MNKDYLSRLIRERTVNGHIANQQDYQDAFRALADAATMYGQLDDETGQALCVAMMTALIVTRDQPAGKPVYRRGQQVGTAVSRS